MINVEDWIKNKGEEVLRELGIKRGQIILDFGCGTGIYSLLASKIVGDTGTVYALDSDEEGLVDDLLGEIEDNDIRNIKFIKTAGDIDFPIDDNMFDMVLWYDILHLLSKTEKNKLFTETHRVLKKNGVVSYHATHSDNFSRVKDQLEKLNLKYLTKYNKPMFHWAWIQDSTVYNFIKKY